MSLRRPIGTPEPASGTPTSIGAVTHHGRDLGGRGFDDPAGWDFERMLNRLLTGIEQLAAVSQEVGR